MSQVSVIAKLKAKEGKRDDLVAAMAPLVEHTAEESGTLTYTLHSDAADADVVWVYELYSDKDALTAHSGTDEMKAFIAGIREVIAGAPEMWFLAPLTGKGIE